MKMREIIGTAEPPMLTSMRSFINAVQTGMFLSEQFGGDFDAWFAGSKIVDSNGRPLRVYHGTSKDFLSFEVDAANASNDAGFYFSADPHYASKYANNFDQSGIVLGANVRPCYLSIKNPFFCLTKPTDIQLKLGTRGGFTHVVINHLQQQGYDGVVVGMTDYEYELGARAMEKDAEEICAFSPQQVRSAVTLESTKPRLLGEAASDHSLTPEQIVRIKALNQNSHFNVEILVNPKPADIRRFAMEDKHREIRTMIADGKLYVCQASECTHSMMAELLEIPLDRIRGWAKYRLVNGKLEQCR